MTRCSRSVSSCGYDRHNRPKRFGGRRKRDFRPMDALDSWRLSTCAPRTESGARPFRPHATPGLCSRSTNRRPKCAQPALPQQGRMAQEIGASGDDHHLLPDRSTTGAIVRRGGLGTPIVISVIFFVIYYIISSSGEKMAKEGTWEAFYGTWLSAFVLAPVAIYSHTRPRTTRGCSTWIGTS